MRAAYRLAKDTKPINHLLFMDDLELHGASKDQLDSLVQVVRIFSQDIRMSFGLDKCEVIEMRRRRQVRSSGYTYQTISISDKSKHPPVGCDS